jgi:hypothetical protein
MKKLTLIIFLLAGIFSVEIDACTTAIISGKYTKDGRPLLWKNRDTWAVNNKIMHFKDGKYEYTGLVNSKDKKGKSVWIGFNSTGFAIMNSASYNLNNHDTIEQSGLEGRIIKQALQTCATIDDFEQLLKDMPQPSRLEANFGVIDGQGGAAYFELANFHYTKIDANDPAVAPFGYVIRTNYSFTGEIGVGGGYIRYVTANKVFDAAAKNNELSAQTILQKASRNLTHSLTGDNLWDNVNIPANHKKFAWFVDYIPRRGSASSIVVEGVNKDENPEDAVMWTVLGFPLTSITIPVWLDSDMQLPQVLTYNEDLKDAPLCHYALELKKDVYCYRWGLNKKYYINVNALLNADNKGFMQVLPSLENKIYQEAYVEQAHWEKDGLKVKELNEFYQWIDQTVTDFYKEKFPQLNIQ